MSKPYGYNRRIHSYRYLIFRRYFFGAVILIFLGGIFGGALLYDLYRSNQSKNPPTSPLQSQTIAGNTKTFRSPYFQFQDSGNWILNTQETTDTKYIYYKYRGLAIEHQLIIYINQVPIPLYLAVSRALPVYIVNGTGLQVTNVSSPCVKAYAPNEPHRLKEVSLNETTMLCDPDTPLYTVVLADVGSDYKLKMQRLDGTPVQFVITYRDLTFDPGQTTIKNVASTFQAL